jgi:hypothetical protein
MKYYTILNFEDPNPGNSTGKIQGGRNLQKLGAGASAGGTAEVYKKREAQFDKATMVFYPCQELIARDRTGTLSKDDVADIRKHIDKSKTVVFIIHGKPDDTDSGFSTSGGAVCTFKELGRLAKLLMPVRDEPYRVSLIMCYGARCSNVRLNHDGMIPPGALATSFAYKFFRELCGARNVRMVAWTGAVSNDGDLKHTCENEEQVLYVDKKQEVAALQASSQKQDIDLEKSALLKKHNITDQDFGNKVLFKFSNNPNAAPTNEIDAFAIRYLPYSPMRANWMMNLYPNRTQTSNYGKIIYAFDGAQLVITNRYGSTGGLPVNTELYRGPLL